MRRTTSILYMLPLLAIAACGGTDPTPTGDPTPGPTPGTAFTVTATTPPDDVTGVAINAPIKVVFSKSADPATINTTTVLVDGVTGAVSYDDSSRTATFTPTAPLAKLTTYHATVTTGAKDTTSVALAASHGWTFTTGPVVATREAHTLVLKSDGTLWSWGRNTDGALGDGTRTQRDAPVAATALAGVTLASLATGANHSLALTSDGRVLGWGRNWAGELGRGTHATQELVPAEVSGLSDVKAIVAGRFFSLALKRDGTVWAWGQGDSGVLGDGTDESRYSPVQALGLSSITMIAAGATHGIALKADGTVWTWGQNGSGQIGNGTIGVPGTPGSQDVFTPLQVTGLSGVVAIAAGFRHNLVLKNDGTVWGWGGNANSLFGDAPAAVTTPIQLTSLANVAAISSGYWHSLALKSDGTAWGWGTRLGVGDGLDFPDPNTAIPLQTVGLADVAVLAGGDGYSLALERDGTVLTWGHPGEGDLGLGSGLPIVWTATTVGVF
jgi:alpha-tubulin suppressor-like RCC1 family protein